MAGSRVAVVGAGWAGLAAAVEATRAGHQVTLFEASRTLGGRARSIEVGLPDGGSAILDNGQHVLIGAYRQTLELMQSVGVRPADVLLPMPLTLRGPDGQGLRLPAWPAPLDAAWGILRAGGWDWADRLSLLRAAWRWRRAGFRCAAHESVASLCKALTHRVTTQVIEPLCVSALNTPPAQASAQVFLQVLKDSLFGRGWKGWGASWLLLPRAPLGALFPEAAATWLEQHGAALHTGHRVALLARTPAGWQVDGDRFDAAILACPSWDALRLVQDNGIEAAAWSNAAAGLRHEAIATVYASGGPSLPAPMLALPSGPKAPAQFVFDRHQLGGPRGLLAFVVSASLGEREAIERQVMTQARALGWSKLQPLRTVVEKRATFACTPGLQRPAIEIAPQLWACGDWVQGPYPASLEGAVMAAQHAVQAISATRRTAR